MNQDEHSDSDLLRSIDDGKTWTDKDEILVRNDGRQNVMSVSLLRLADGRIALFYLVKNSNQDCRPHVRFSTDEAKTWTEAAPCVPEGGGYFVVNNGRAVQLAAQVLEADDAAEGDDSAPDQQAIPVPDADETPEG